MPEITARGGETLCFLAVEFGYADCRPLRSANPHLQNRETLEAGDRVTVPEVTRRMESGQTETLHRFRRPLTDQPQIQFVFEEGRGYGQNLPEGAAGATGARRNRPDLDRRLPALSLTNYVVDRTGDGFVADTFPRADFFGFHAEASRDPDHFKVQVHAPRLPAGQRQVRVTLFAMRPVYFKGQRGGRDVVLQHPTRFVKPTSADRRLDVLCERIGNTAFFRSPYLRLVGTPGGRAPRQQQALFVGDYFQEATQRGRKFYTEILNSQVLARGRLRMCPLARCAVRATARIVNGPSAHLAFHLLTDALGPVAPDGSAPSIPSVSQDQIRERVYEWTRRVFAPAHVRPVIEHMQEVPVPNNVLIIANINDATRGMRASGRGPAGRRSIMRFMVESSTLTLQLQNNHRPEDTADAIIDLITRRTPALAGFRAEKFVLARHDVSAGDTARAAPCDVAVWRPDGSPAFVLADGSNDRPHNGLGPQSLHTIPGIFFANPDPSRGDIFPANTSFVLATPSQRTLRWNYFVPNCLNIYVFNARIIADASGNEFNGWTPLGNFRGDATDVGPCVYLSKPGADQRLALAHEMCHALMHVFHAHSPNKQPAPPPPAAGAPPPIGRTELMGEGLLDETDDHQMSRHISDAPIGAFYDIPEEPRGFSLLNGEIPLAPDGLPATPVLRLFRVGSFYRILRTNADVPLDPSVTDLPVDQAAAEAQANADDAAAAGI